MCKAGGWRGGVILSWREIYKWSNGEACPPSLFVGLLLSLLKNRGARTFNIRNHWFIFTVFSFSFSYLIWMDILWISLWVEGNHTMKIPTDFAKRLTKQTRERARAGTTEAFRFVFRYAEWALRALIYFTLSNARRFYSWMGNPLDGKGLIEQSNLKAFMHHDKSVPGSSTPIIRKVS